MKKYKLYFNQIFTIDSGEQYGSGFKQKAIKYLKFEIHSCFVSKLSLLWPKMISPVEYRSVIKFLLLRKMESAEIIQQLRETYKEDCPARATIYKWIQLFKSGRESVFDTEKEGRPCEIPDEKKDLCKKIITTHRRITVTELSHRLNISVGSTHSMLSELGIRKLCSRFVPRFLTGEMCQRRLECCKSNLKLLNEYGDRFLENIVTEDETPLSLYSPESKRESTEWRLPSESAARKLRCGTAHGREFMLSVFWDRKGIIKADFLEKGYTMDGAYYSALLEEVRKERRKPKGTPLFLLHDNAPIHTCRITTSKIQQFAFELLQHPPYSPDLAPSDFILFRELKKKLRGRHFHSSLELKEAVMDFHSGLSENFFKKAFEELVSRWQKCVEQQGSYIEK